MTDMTDLRVTAGRHYMTAAGTNLGPMERVDHIYAGAYRAGNDLRKNPILYERSGIPVGGDPTSHHTLIKDVTREVAPKKAPKS
jgi:hypothetical protein